MVTPTFINSVLHVVKRIEYLSAFKKFYKYKCGKSVIYQVSARGIRCVEII